MTREVTEPDPRRRGGVAGATVGDRTVLLDRVWSLHWLNPSAAAIWARCDGTSSIEAIAAGIAAELGIEASAIVADVRGAVRALAVAGLVGPDDGDDLADAEPELEPEAAAEAADGIERVPVSCPSCVADLDRMGWTQPFAVQLGNTRLGVRGSDPEVDALLRQLLAAHIVDDPAVGANYSVRLVPPSRGRGPRELHQLYDDKNLRSGSTRGADVVAHLLAALGTRRLWAGGGDGLLAIDAPGLLLDDGVHLGPLVWEALPGIARRLGAPLLARPVAIDPDTGDVVVPERLDVDAAAWAEIVERFGELSHRGPAAPGRYPLDEIVLAGDDAGLEGAVAAVVGLAHGAHGSTHDALRATLRVVLDDAGELRVRWVELGAGERTALFERT